jgi:hypothetical protein
MDCWTLDTILGLHVALHRDLCILDHLGRLADPQAVSWIVCISHPSDFLQCNQWRFQVISGFATMTIGNSPKTAELGWHTAGHKRSQTSSCCMCPAIPVFFQISSSLKQNRRYSPLKGLEAYFRTLPDAMFTSFRCFTGECAAWLESSCMHGTSCRLNRRSWPRVVSILHGRSVWDVLGSVNIYT